MEWNKLIALALPIAGYLVKLSFRTSGTDGSHGRDLS